MPAPTLIAQAVATSLSRRKFIGMMGGAPLAISGSSLLSLAACGGGSSGSSAAGSTAKATSVKFNNMAAPTAVADRATTFTNATIDIGYSDGSTKAAQALSYNLIYKTGVSLPRPDGGTAVTGGYYYPDGVTPIVDTTATPYLQFFSDCPDGQSLLKLANTTVSGVAGNPLFLVTQFEYLTVNNKQGATRGDGYVVGGTSNSMYGRMPSQIGIATLSQDKTTGALSPVYYYPVPTTDAHGLWITCAGSLSPWNTHLSSEEYEPDAWKLASSNIATYAADSGVLQFQAFSTNTFGNASAAKPYRYGHVPEVTVHADGTGSLIKHYCLGRISREIIQVMPDNRSVLMGDDATNGGIFMFIADVAGNLSSGTLYAAKLTQTSATAGGAFTFQWIKLGQTTSAAIEYLADTLEATDIMDIKSAATTGYTTIGYSGATQYMKLNAGMELAAAFLETHRYAAYVGATMETTKFEGVALNVADKKAYIAMSAIKSTMSDTSGDIKLPKVNSGAVYELTLAGSQSDTAGNAIDSAWVPTSMSVPAALLGEDLATPDAYGNTANNDKIANPDNLKFSEKLRTLFIGEDSGMHVNNFIWAWNVDTKALARIYSAPAGAECTGLQAVDNLNGFSYVMANFQHPGDWEAFHATLLAAQPTLDSTINSNWGNKKQVAIGYISGIPSLG